MPFILKMYAFNIDKKILYEFCKSAESLILRHRLVGTRAYLESRLNDVYQNFTSQNPNVNPIIDLISELKTTKDGWWAYWNTDKLDEAIQGSIDPKIAKYILWKYENHLQEDGKKGYQVRFDSITSPELEHIAPQTPTNGEPLASGYCKYDADFTNEYINCLGNYLLISKSHNCSVGNKSFKEKRDSYSHLCQQREIQNMTNDDKPVWDKKLIKNRHVKIVKFILDTF
jgi:hypothetical protein